jgi:copper(I)-binding protein
VTPATAAGHHGHDMAAMAGMGNTTVRAGSLEISGGAVKAMLPGAKVGGGGFTVKNDGSEGDTLISVESPAAGRVELHEMTMQNDVMKMRKLDDGIVIPAGETVELKSGGLHLMFMDVKKPFAEGDSVPVTLTFEKSGKVDYVLPVGNAGGAHKHN